VCFEEWYETVKDKYPIEKEALKLWEKMCELAYTYPYRYREVENCDDLEWFQFEDKLEMLEKNLKDAEAEAETDSGPSKNDSIHTASSTMPELLYTFDSLTDNEKAIVNNDAFKELFIDAFGCAFENAFKVSFQDEALVKNLMAEYFKMGDETFIDRYDEIDQDFANNMCEMSVNTLKQNIRFNAFGELNSEKTIREECDEFITLFEFSFEDIFMEEWKNHKGRMYDMMVEYINIGHETFLTHYSKEKEDFMEYVNNDMMVLLKKKLPKMNMDLEQKLTVMKEMLGIA
jgi:hypothetical protein